MISETFLVSFNGNKAAKFPTPHFVQKKKKERS